MMPIILQVTKMYGITPREVKLVINIPCYNEEKTLPLVLKELPKKINGIHAIEVQIVDDGSTDKTSEVAAKLGVDRIIRHKHNLGLGPAFKHGVEAALEHGCDILVNTDGDNQYPSSYIPVLIQPLLDGNADIVIGNRRPWKVKHFSPFKRFFQWFGNIAVRWIIKSDVPDAVSGFRAYSKYALLKINVVTKFSYVLDTLMQASKKGLKVVSVPIHTNKPTRKSRLFKNIFEHMIKSGTNILRLYTLYEPFKTFLLFALAFVIPGIILASRFFVDFIIYGSSGHVQSLLLGILFIVISSLMFVLGIIGDLLKTNRELIEEQLYYEKQRKYNN